MQFVSHNITEFLEEWNIECEDFGLTGAQRCTRFPNYCTPEIKETVKLLPGYIAMNWITLQSDVKKLWTYYGESVHSTPVQTLRHMAAWGQ